MLFRHWFIESIDEFKLTIVNRQLSIVNCQFLISRLTISQLKTRHSKPETRNLPYDRHPLHHHPTLSDQFKLICTGSQ